MLQPEQPFEHVEVLTPFDPGNYDDHRSVVLDIYARMADGSHVQVEMQRAGHAGLRPRVVYNWGRVYTNQLRRAQAYTELHPVISIWVCDFDLFPQAQSPHLTFELRERHEGQQLTDHIRVDILRLPAWHTQRDGVLEEPVGRWFWFFNEASRWRCVPEAIRIPVMEEALNTLQAFREDRALNALYWARLEAERLEVERQQQLEHAEQELVRVEQALAESEHQREREVEARQLAELEQARLRKQLEDRTRELETLLANLGGVPDDPNH